MADNLAVTPGSGATVAADSISSVLYQRVKVTLGADGANDGDVASGNPLPVSASTLPLPTGASTSAKQDTGNSSLSSIDGKAPALGQALAAASIPVVLPVAQITTLTPPAAITGFATSTKQSDKSQITQVCDGSGNVIGATSNALDINIKSGNPTTITATQGTATNLKAQAECYQGGAAVASGNPLQVTLANGSVPSHAVTNSGTFAVQAACTNSGTFAVQSTDSVNSKTILSIKAAYTASQTAATVLTPTSGKKFVITDIVISASAAGTVYLFDNTDSATTGLCPTLSLAANGGWNSNFKGMYTATATNNLIKYTSGSGAAGSIVIFYYEV